MKVHVYDTKTSVARNFAAYLEKKIRESEEYHIALSGGSTPRILFEELSSTDRYKINWEKVYLYWGDERCVPPEDEQSNYKMTRDYLLRNVPVPEGNIHRIMGENEPSVEALRYGILLDRELPSDSEIPVFDMVILGMGEDGHTASIFPHEIQLWDSEQNCEVATHPESGQKRVTLTGRVINRSKEVVFLVTGAGKADKVQSILQKTAGYRQYPAALVEPVGGKLSWFLDEEAASTL
ncbi:6-phosphogluconolactonase [Muriicola marianensis]|uniref:6-phosphogluconolactonase n=1 Tax=Muriicola marianensis TaxID=1324801 RepID=A0ABQ1R5N0_9FLAO|nr:6-phosphogluconolactonase [Muriicola marianensis]GGD59015.1 6-phosphogluconolactonase [Muriicola marianensis]